MTLKGLVLVYPWNSETGVLTDPGDWKMNSINRLWADHYDNFDTVRQRVIDKNRFVQTKRVLDASRDPQLVDDKPVIIACGEQELLAELITVPGATWYTIQQIRDGVDADAVTIRDSWLDERDPPGVGEIVQLYDTVAGFDYPAAMESTVPEDFT